MENKMAHTDLKFFTNEPERDLYSRFATILKSNTQFFDVLVGYFRSSGFFKMAKELETVEKIRIIVGLNIDKFSMKLIDEANGTYKYTSLDEKGSREEIANEIVSEFEKTEYSKDVESGTKTFIEWIKTGKMELRMYNEAPIHAKVYIMRKDPEKVPDTFGSVITGSSNFSEAGLQNNLEFNVELKDRTDVEFALKKFEELWEKSIDIKNTYIDTIENKTWLRDNITPYELYLKTLYEFFREEINLDKEYDNTPLPTGYMELLYQRDAVTQAKQKLDAYNGVFISDVVGLGKTYICAMLANRFNRGTWKLIVCPPVLKSYWEDVLKEFDVSRCDIVSLGSLEKFINNNDIKKYSYVFVDEAHRFRNRNTDNFTYLHQICRDKKVILISATPINNYASDIESQLYLFQPKQNGTINGIKNLELFFRKLKSNLSDKVKGSKEYIDQIRKNSDIIRDKLLREVMIRRTRAEIVKYYKDDLEKQGLKFPKVEAPEKIVYVFDDETNKAFNETIKTIKDFNYARYMPLVYLKPEKQKEYNTMLAAQHNMGGFMKSVLAKRLESSFYAFKNSLNRFIESYEKFIKMFNDGEVYISKSVNVYDLLDDGDLNKLMYYVEENEVMKLKSTDFKDDFILKLNQDLNSLNYLKDMWAKIETDPKLDKFIKELKTNKKLSNKKKIIFTESRETAEYLKENLKGIYGDRIINFSGQSSNTLKNEIENSFDPKKKNLDNDKYDILITTDVLAEGVNLHRANILINYDLPWNPTRIMQRVGRVNRVGSEHDNIYIFNFFPTDETKQYISLEDSILTKLQAFHDTLGEDIKYLSEDEDVSSKKLFDELNKSIDDEEENANPELSYLAVIRQIRDNDESLFDKIKNLPKKARAGKEFTDEKKSVISFIRKGALKTFFKTDSSLQTIQLSFIDAIKYIECDSNEKKVKIDSDYEKLYKTNNIEFDNFLSEENTTNSENAEIVGNDAKVIKTLKAIKSTVKTLSDEQDKKIDIIINRLENGEIPAQISKDVVKKVKNNKSNDFLKLCIDIISLVPVDYYRELTNIKKKDENNKEVILSCYLKKEGN